MDPLMKAIKAAYSISGNSASVELSDVEKQRSSMELFGKIASLPIGVKTETFSVLSKEGHEIRCEKVRPEFLHHKDKVILYCHGGGYDCGNLNYARILASKLAYDCSMNVIDFEYRLAPECPYPGMPRCTYQSSCAFYQEFHHIC